MHTNARNFQRCRHLRRSVYMLPHQHQMIHTDLSTKIKERVQISRIENEYLTINE